MSSSFFSFIGFNYDIFLCFYLFFFSLLCFFFAFYFDNISFSLKKNKLAYLSFFIFFILNALLFLSRDFSLAYLIRKDDKKAIYHELQLSKNDKKSFLSHNVKSLADESASILELN